MIGISLTQVSSLMIKPKCVACSLIIHFCLGTLWLLCWCASSGSRSPPFLKGHHLFFLRRSSIQGWCLLKLLWLPKMKTSTQMHTHMCLCIWVKSQFTCLLFLLLPTLYSGRIVGHHLCTYIHTYIYSHMHTNVCLYMCVCVSIYMYIYMYVCIYIYVYIENMEKEYF